VDENYGENQDIPGSDGIGDTSYSIPGGSNQDRYPLMNPWPLIRSVEVSISPSYQSGSPGGKLDYTVTVTNTGAGNDNFDLKVIDNENWSPSLSDNSLEISAGGSENVTLSVTIPDNASYGAEDLITVTATSRTENMVSDNGSCMAYVVSWTGTVTFKLENLYMVGLEKDLQLYTGSKLVVKFYKYDNVTLQAESIIENIAPPKSVVENENVPHPRAAERYSWGTVQIATLVLTTDNENEVISTIASFTVHQSNLRTRYGAILKAWAANPPLQSAFRAEIGDILKQWASAPT